MWAYAQSLGGELSRSHSHLVVAALVVTYVLLRKAAPEERRRLVGMTVFVGLHLVLVPVAAYLHQRAAPSYREVRLAHLVFAALSCVGMAQAVIFSLILPRLHLNVPRILRDVLGAAAAIIAIFVVASRAGLNLSGLIATSAVLTAVIGFSLQDTLGNIMGGLALQMDNSVQVGDWIKLGDVAGQVTEIRWRYTAIETRNWETVIVPNSHLMKGQVMVLGRRIGQPSLWRRTVYFNVDFRYQPSDIIDAVTAALRVPIDRVAREPLPNCVLMDLSDSFGRYAVRYWLTDFAHDDGTDSEVRTRIYFALKRAGVPLSIPAHALFVTEESAERKQEKGRAERERRLAALARVDLFSVLAEEDRNRLADALRYAPFTRGEILTKQGAEAHWLYMIIEGEAVVRVASAGGLEREVARLRAGNFFGEGSLMTGEPRTATVVAATDVVCYRLDKAAFQQILERRPELAEHVAEMMAKRRVQLAAVKEGLDADAQKRRLAATKTDVLSKIRVFFGLPNDRRAVS